MGTQVQRISGKLDQPTFSKRIFAGELLVTSKLERLTELVALIREQLEQAFSPYPPDEAHRYIAHKKYFAICCELQDSFSKNRLYKQKLAKSLVECGWDAGTTYSDRLLLRIVPPRGKGAIGGVHSHIQPHRDTWGSNIHQQINFWSTVYPLKSNRTILLYPEYWNKPIANSTHSWKYGEYLKARVQGKGDAPDYPSTPQPLEQPAGDGLQPVIEPSEWLIFSSQHLHASVSNTSNTTRFSFETRLLFASDLESGRRAPNTDNEGKNPLSGLFSNLETQERLPPYLLQYIV